MSTPADRIIDRALADLRHQEQHKEPPHHDVYDDDDTQVKALARRIAALEKLIKHMERKEARRGEGS